MADSSHSSLDMISQFVEEDDVLYSIPADCSVASLRQVHSYNPMMSQFMDECDAVYSIPSEYGVQTSNGQECILDPMIIQVEEEDDDAYSTSSECSVQTSDGQVSSFNPMVSQVEEEVDVVYSTPSECETLTPQGSNVTSDSEAVETESVTDKVIVEMIPQPVMTHQVSWRGEQHDLPASSPTHEHWQLHCKDVPCDVFIGDDFFAAFHLEKSRVIGKGMCGNVVLAITPSMPERQFAVKSFSLNTTDQGKANKSMYTQEIVTLRQLNHKNIISNVCGVNCPSQLLLVMPYYPRGNLRGILDNVTEDQAGVFFFQVCDAVSHMFSRRIAHLDIKLDNILLDHGDNIVVTDFGLSRVKDSQSSVISMRGGTCAYWAPECFQREEDIDPFKVDVYATGVVLWSLVFQKQPHPSVDFITFSRQRRWIRPDYKYYVETLLEDNPDSRTTMPEFLKRVQGMNNF